MRASQSRAEAGNIDIVGLISGGTPSPGWAVEIMDQLAELLTAAGTLVALLALLQAVLEFVDSNAIRRYEKFHEMSRRFDDNLYIQRVIAWLHRPDKSIAWCSEDLPGLTMPEKEKFACFMEEIYYMMNSNIVRDEVALYTYGYYVKLTLADPHFYRGLKKCPPYAIESRGDLEAFCRTFKEDCPGWSNYIDFAKISWCFDPLKPAALQAQAGWFGRFGFWRIYRRRSAYFY